MNPQELIGKKIVPIFHTDPTVNLVWTVLKATENERGEIDCLVGRKNETTVFYGFNRTFRIALPDEVEKDHRIDELCPHQLVTYRQFSEKADIPPKYWKYSNLDSDMVPECDQVYVCNWCKAHIRRD